MVGLLMGQTAENLAYRFGITRARDGRVRGAQPRARARRAEGRALRRRGRAALRHGRQALRGRRRRARGLDGREPRQAEAVLRPQVRQRHRRQQLAGHRRRARGSCSRRERAVEKHKLDADRAASSIRNGRASIRRRWASGPVHAATPILQAPRPRRSNDLDAWEINEAFAAQVIACLARVGRATSTAASELGLPGALGDARPGEAQRRRRRDRARPSGRRVGRAHRAARAERARAHRRQARHRRDLHRRRPGRRDAGRARVASGPRE